MHLSRGNCACIYYFFHLGAIYPNFQHQCQVKLYCSVKFIHLAQLMGIAMYAMHYILSQYDEQTPKQVQLVCPSLSTKLDDLCDSSLGICHDREIQYSNALVCPATIFSGMLDLSITWPNEPTCNRSSFIAIGILINEMCKYYYTTVDAYHMKL